MKANRASIRRAKSTGSDASTGRRVSFAKQAELGEITPSLRLTGTSNVPVKPFDGGTPRSYTPETFSDASSMTDGEPYEIIEYDPSKQITSFNLTKQAERKAERKAAAAAWEELETDESFDESEAIAFQIGDNTPAAEALRASANVRVSRVGKAARAVHMQAVRRFVKRATLTGKQGVVKGKPPRLPPRRYLDGEVEDVSDLGSDAEQDEGVEEAVSQQDMSSHHPDDEAVVPDDVVQGTVEAGRKGTSSTPTAVAFVPIHLIPIHLIIPPPLPSGTYPYSQFSGRSIPTTC
jgi:hypothetical protein